MSYISEISVGGKSYKYYNLSAAAKDMGYDLSKLPFGIKILAENLLRNENGTDVKKEDIKACFAFAENKGKLEKEIAYKPVRVLMQDFTGVPAVVDLAAMRDAVEKMGGKASKINPIAQSHLVIDHSVQVDYYAVPDAMIKNTEIEMQRNRERYEFLKWGMESFDNFKVVPPGTGICHQVNLEYIAKVVWQKDGFAFPDTCVGTDSHTTMVNGLGVLGWGVGGIEAESVMLGQFISLLLPEVVGFKLKGKLLEGVTATDLVLTITEILRKKKVVGKFVEFYGTGVNELHIADRATISNMAPEYGATCGLFAPDDQTLKYLHLTGRNEHEIQLVESYMKAQGMWFDPHAEPVFSEVIELDLATVKPCLAGPKRPQDRVLLEDVKKGFREYMATIDISGPSEIPSPSMLEKGTVIDENLTDGSIVIAAITSCTNTSNPEVLIAAGLLAKKAYELGLKVKPFVKTSLAPGSRVVEAYLLKSGLQTYLDKLGFNIVGFGCTTCIGNSGPLKPEFEEIIAKQQLTVASILSGNRNFEGRIHPLTKLNYLASPPLVVAYAIAGTLNVDLTTKPIGFINEKAIYLRDIWPSNKEIKAVMDLCITREMFRTQYANVYEGDSAWKQIDSKKTETYSWKEGSSYIENPPYFEGMKMEFDGKISNIVGARALLVLGDSITTDHISPAGDISKTSPAALYLRKMGVQEHDFNSYGARRGSHSVMMRGTFANIRIKNEMLETEGPFSKVAGKPEVLSVYDTAMEYKKMNTPLVVIAGMEYGTGSSRDWAAKGTFLLGVKAVIAESFERIHRSNLVGMGVLPLQFTNDETRKTLKIKGEEKFSIIGVDSLSIKSMLKLIIEYPDGSTKETKLLARVDTKTELEYIRNGGIMQFVIRDLLK